MALFKSGVIGLDLSCKQIKFVELGGTVSDPKIINYGKTLTTSDTIKDGKVVDIRKFADVLDDLWKSFNIKSRDIVLGIGNNDVVIRFVNLPKMPLDRLGNLIRFQIGDFMPVTIEEFEIDFSVISESITESGTMSNVLIVAARKKMLYNFIEAFNINKHRITDIKSSVLVMDKLVPEEHTDDVSVVVNITIENCNILIMNKKTPMFARSTAFKQSMDDDINLLINSGAGTEGSDMDRAVNTVVSFIGEEIRTSISYFQSQNLSVVINKVFLLGCISKHNKVYEGILEQMGSSLEIVNPYEEMFLSVKNTQSFDVNPSEYALALSLALHGLEE